MQRLSSLPNGSGKSNVVDAISWVLGTQSPGALRTNKMEDVIFAGTEKLSEKGFAEVYLNFVVDADKFNGSEEISIGRKLYRDGASEYFMNGLNCRLLDIQEFAVRFLKCLIWRKKQALKLLPRNARRSRSNYKSTS